MVRETGLDSRAAALGHSRLSVSTGHRFTTAPTSSPVIETKKLKQPQNAIALILVRETGLEPVRDYHTPLKRARLPIPPLSLEQVAL